METDHVTVFRDEVKVTMQMLGVTDIAQLHPGLINTRDIDHLVPGVEEDGEREMRHPYAGFQGLKSKL